MDKLVLETEITSKAYCWVKWQIFATDRGWWGRFLSSGALMNDPDLFGNDRDWGLSSDRKGGLEDLKKEMFNYFWKELS